MKIAKIVLLIVNITVTIFIFSMLYSASRISFEPGSTQTVMGINFVKFKSQFKITNRGFYDITDLRIYVKMTNSTGFVLAENQTLIGVIKGGASQQGYIVLIINFADLYYNLSHDDLFNVHIEINCKYAFSIISVSLKVNQPLSWNAPLGS